MYLMAHIRVKEYIAASDQFRSAREYTVLMPFRGAIQSAARCQGVYLLFELAVPRGAKNFVVKDPDGNLLLFAGPAN